ncbi:alpha/beta fold hydrolase [Muricoccus pecuniae]|uniref:Pimeloyl-ACP methyl ester carboxylesterase n=1 Tax=Muricoccus pecuniae TaxID=693023 RepID=A0A840Y4Q8_9PROT|nr:alpha/beta hydrolase [Roseomonas pecuniae]MBB5695715.1 pimeloyl-ACP methyl ester carboxylesterase [Roseomonas pecuniae]
MASPEGPIPGAFRCALGPATAVLRWVEWGPPDGMPVVCVHGLTRTGRDFDALAKRLASLGRRVICPDVFGRGNSDWLPDGTLYAVPVYALAFRQFLEALPRPYDWVGTSMGGLIGMAVAGMPEFAPRRMVLNDVGPFLPAAALRRIAAYLSLRPDFTDLDEVETHLRLVHAGFGQLSDETWRQMAETSARRAPGGRLVLHYDPAIAGPMLGGEIADVDLWPVWEAVSPPVLVLRGAESDLLEEGTAARMAERPGVTLATIPGCGHAPGLVDPVQTDLIVDFLSGSGAATRTD